MTTVESNSSVSFPQPEKKLPPSLAQEGKEIVNAFQRVEASQKPEGRLQGRLYLVIGVNNKMSVTDNPKMASSAETIVKFVNDLNTRYLSSGAQTIFQEKLVIHEGKNEKEEILSYTLKDLVKINKLCSRLSAKLPQTGHHKRNKIRDVAASILPINSSLKTLLKEQAITGRAIVDRYGEIANERKLVLPEGEEKDYGKYEGIKYPPEGDPIKAEKSHTYETYYQHVKSRGKEKVSFQRLSTENPEKLSRQSIGQAFKNELENEVSKSALTYINGCFDTVLNGLANRVEAGQLSPEEASRVFHESVKNYIIFQNNLTLSLDRETFHELTKTDFKGFEGGPLSNTQEFRQLYKEYEEGNWVDIKNEEGEVINPRELKEEYLSTEPYIAEPNNSDFKKAMGVVNGVMGQEPFTQVIQTFFAQAAPKTPS